MNQFHSLRSLAAAVAVPLAAAPLAAAPLAAAPGEPIQEALLEATAQAVVMAKRAALRDLGLDELSGFIVKDQMADDLGLIHVRLQQTYRGLPVMGAQAIVHMDTLGREGPMTDALVRGIQLETTPNLAPGEALAVAMDRVAPQGPLSEPPAAELVVWPEPPDADPPEDVQDDAPAPAPVRHHLAYHVHLELENGKAETRHEDFLVDAHTGAVLRAWSTLFTLKRKPGHSASGTPAKGLGSSQYSGEVNLDTVRTSQGYELRDPTRGDMATLNLGGLGMGPAAPYVNHWPLWGDGQNYDPGQGPTSVNGQTAAVDAHYGLQMTWDFYKNILGRNGIDGRGTTPTNLVHFAKDFENAFWSDECFCVVYGDGPDTGSLTALDVVGHELSHGLCNTTAGLIYEGESGGMAEANSDIFGALIGFYARGAKGAGNTVPDQGGAWTIGEALMGKPMRYMYKPSRDGVSPNEWSPTLRFRDPHESSGPLNRAFYFLAQGASAKPRSETYSRRLPQGMKGIGNDKAIRIWWRTLSTRLTPTSTYRQARAGALKSARELYGKDSPEAVAVGLAFHGINVGNHSR